MSIGGLSTYGAEQAMAAAAVLPNATNRWVGLLTTLPSDRVGTGLVEASGSSYARIAHAAWTNSTVADVTVRANNGAVTFAALSGTLADILGWAVWDDDGSPVGNLIAFGPLVDSDELPVTRTFLAGDEPRFASGELKVRVAAG